MHTPLLIGNESTKPTTSRMQIFAAAILLSILLVNFASSHKFNTSNLGEHEVGAADMDEIQSWMGLKNNAAELEDRFGPAVVSEYNACLTERPALASYPHNTIAQKLDVIYAWRKTQWNLAKPEAFQAEKASEREAERAKKEAETNLVLRLEAMKKKKSDEDFEEKYGEEINEEFAKVLQEDSGLKSFPHETAQQKLDVVYAWREMMWNQAYPRDFKKKKAQRNEAERLAKEATYKRAAGRWKLGGKKAAWLEDDKEYKRLIICFHQDHEKDESLTTGELWLLDTCNWVKVLNHGKPQVTVEIYHMTAFNDVMARNRDAENFERIIIHLAAHGQAGNPKQASTSNGDRGKNQAVISSDTIGGTWQEIGDLTYMDILEGFNAFRKRHANSPTMLSTSACFGEYIITGPRYAEDPFPIVTTHGFVSGTVYVPSLGRSPVSAAQRAANPHLKFVSWQANLDVLTGEMGWDQIIVDEIANMGDDHMSKISGENFKIQTNVLENMRSKVMRMISGIKLRSLTWSTDSYHRGDEAKADDWDSMDWIWTAGSPMGHSFFYFNMAPKRMYISMRWNWADKYDKMCANGGSIRHYQSEMQEWEKWDLPKQAEGLMFFVLDSSTPGTPMWHTPEKDMTIQNSNAMAMHDLQVGFPVRGTFDDATKMWRLSWDAGVAQNCDKVTFATVRLYFTLEDFMKRSVADAKQDAMDNKFGLNDALQAESVRMAEDEIVQQARADRQKMMDKITHGDADAVQRLRDQHAMEGAKGFGGKGLVNQKGKGITNGSPFFQTFKTGDLIYDDLSGKEVEILGAIRDSKNECLHVVDVSTKRKYSICDDCRIRDPRNMDGNPLGFNFMDPVYVNGKYALLFQESGVFDKIYVHAYCKNPDGPGQWVVEHEKARRAIKIPEAKVTRKPSNWDTLNPGEWF